MFFYCCSLGKIGIAFNSIPIPFKKPIIFGTLISPTRKLQKLNRYIPNFQDNIFFLLLTSPPFFVNYNIIKYLVNHLQSSLMKISKKFFFVTISSNQDNFLGNSMFLYFIHLRSILIKKVFLYGLVCHMNFNVVFLPIIYYTAWSRYVNIQESIIDSTTHREVYSTNMKQASRALSQLQLRKLYL